MPRSISPARAWAVVPAPSCAHLPIRIEISPAPPVPPWYDERMAVTSARGGRAAQAVHRRKAKAAQRAAPEQVSVGFFPDQKYDDGTPVATVAVVNEFGSDNARKESAFSRTARRWRRRRARSAPP